MKTKNGIGWAALAVLIFATGIILGPIQANCQTKARQKIVVHLSHYADDSHVAMMAVHFAQYLQEHGADVTLMLDVDGVRLADQRQGPSTASGTNAQTTASYDAFVKAGGKVLVCPHCAQVAEITAQNLRPGARMGKNLGELADAILAADKILDY